MTPKIYVFGCIILILFVILVFTKTTKNIEKFTNNKIVSSYYINLDRNNSRRKYMEEQFIKNKLDVTRFKAFDKKQLNKNMILELKQKKIISYNHNPQPDKYGSIACLMSHANLYKKIYKQYKGGTFLILEDDCKLIDNFKSKLNYYLDKLPPNWDMVWFGYNNIKGHKIDKYFYKPEQGLHWGYNSQHHCYIINYKFIPKMLEILFPIKPNFNTKDTIIRQNFNKFNAYFCHEKLAVQDSETFPNSERTNGRNG
jgi:GR25 family glycosyltransferase involved in LPS biosynthesis